MIRLGNLTIDQLEERCDWTFEKEDYEWLKEHRQDNAQKLEESKFHIFDIPFSIWSSKEITEKLVDILKKYNDKKHSAEPLRVEESL